MHVFFSDRYISKFNFACSGVVYCVVVSLAGVALYDCDP